MHAIRFDLTIRDLLLWRTERVGTLWQLEPVHSNNLRAQRSESRIISRQSERETDVVIDHESKRVRQIALEAQNRLSVKQLPKMYLSSLERSSNFGIHLELRDGELKEGRGLISLVAPERSFVRDRNRCNGLPSESERLLRRIMSSAVERFVWTRGRTLR